MKLIIKMNLKALTALSILKIFVSFYMYTGLVQAADIPDSGLKKSQIKQIETDLSREKEKLTKVDIKEKSILDQLSDIERAITEKRLMLRGLQQKIRASKKELESRQERVKLLERSLMEIEGLIGNRLVSFYKYAKRGYFQILSNTNSPEQLNHMLKYLRVVIDKDRETMKRMADDQKNYKNEMSRINGQLEAISSLQQTESDRISSLKEDLNKKVILLTKIHKEKEFYETAVKELGSAAQDLREKIVSLERDQQKKESLPAGFADSKGKLPLPLPGKIIKNAKRLGGMAIDTHKGIYIGGDFGTPVRAVFPGRVDFSGQLKGYGQVIVINHGSRFFTISAYLLQREKSEGQMVSVGDIIGQVGESGLFEGPALYFEIREGETNLDPLQWLKVN